MPSPRAPVEGAPSKSRTLSTDQSKPKPKAGAPPPEDRADHDVLAAIARYWVKVLPYGEIVVLSLLVDQVYIFTKGATEREGITREFLITGVLDRKQKIPPLPFGVRQFDEYLRRLKQRGLADVIQKGRGRVAFAVNVDAIRAMGCGSTAMLPSERVAVGPQEGLRSSRRKGCGHTELVSPTQEKPYSEEVLLTTTSASAPVAIGGGGQSASLSEREERASPPEHSPERTHPPIARDPPPSRTIRDDGGRYAGSTPIDVEAIKASLGDVGFALDALESEGEREGDYAPDDPIVVLKRVWVQAHAHIGMEPGPWSSEDARRLLVRFGDPRDAAVLLANAVLHWASAMDHCFSHMTNNPPPLRPKLTFIVHCKERPGEEDLDHPQMLLEQIDCWGEEDADDILALIQGPPRAELEAARVPSVAPETQEARKQRERAERQAHNVRCFIKTQANLGKTLSEAEARRICGYPPADAEVHANAA